MAREDEWWADDNLPKAKINRESLKEALHLFSYLRPYRWPFAGALVFLFLVNITLLVFPFVTGKLIDSAMNVTGPSKFFQNINQITLLLIAMLLVHAFFSYFRIYLFAYVGENALADMRKETYARLITLPMKFFSNRRVGELASRLSADLSQIQDAVTSTFAELLRQIITFIVGVAILFTISSKLTFMMLSVFPVLIAVAVFVGRFIRRLARKAQDQLAESGTIVEVTLQGITNVKAFANEKFEITDCQERLSSESIGNDILSVYPNPSAGTIKVSLRLSYLFTQEAAIMILDQTGKVFFSSEANIKYGILDVQLSANQLPSGFYWLRAVVSDNIYQTELVLQRN